MNEQSDIASLVRAVRARVPMDAAQMLVKETPERIGAVFAELPPLLVELYQILSASRIAVASLSSLRPRRPRIP